jgi:hypothetical protein
MVFGAGLVSGLLGTIGDALDSGSLKTIAKVSTWVLPFEALYQDALNRITADTAQRRVRKGEHLLYTGDYHNAKHLVGAMGRRLGAPPTSRSALEAFRAERKARQTEHETLSRVVVSLDRSYRLDLARAPEVEPACRGVWGEPEADTTLVPLKTLLGMLGAAEVESFLTHLEPDRHVSRGTQKQALNAVDFLYRNVLRQGQRSTNSQAASGNSQLLQAATM